MNRLTASARQDLRQLSAAQLRALDLSHRRLAVDHQKSARICQQWADGARKEIKRRKGERND